jgi:PTH1 family peptidyl-tRNA hydrolase
LENLRLIAGLGNPGGDYARTRHNAGFLAVERLAERWKAEWSYEKKFEARLARAQRSAGPVLLAEPQTYMNSSGESVGAILAFYRIPPSSVLVVVDDADLPLGELRMRPSGSSGGHHGLESVESHLGSRKYARLRIGIGRQDGAREITGHVLGRFSKTEIELVEKVLTVASEQAECWFDAGIQKAMNQFNGTVEGPGNESKEA